MLTMIDLDNDGYSSRADVFAALADRFHLVEPVEELLADDPAERPTQ